MRFSFLSILAALLLFSACKDNETQTGIDFDVTFKATYDGAQLEKNKDYVLGSMPVSFIRYRLYLSDITLLKDDGTEQRISEIEYLDFTADNGSSNMSLTPKITFKNVPEGEYDGIKMGYGVKPSLNAKQPSDFPSGHPLNVEADYWAGWGSYIFMLLDGKADPENDGTKNVSFSYHCGSDPAYLTITKQSHIHVEAGHSGLGIEFDLRKLLTNEDGSHYDIESNPSTSNNVGDVRVALDIMEHYAHAVTINQ